MKRLLGITRAEEETTMSVIIPKGNTCELRIPPSGSQKKIPECKIVSRLQQSLKTCVIINSACRAVNISFQEPECLDF